MKVLRVAIVLFILLVLGAFLRFASEHDIQTLLLDFMDQWDTQYAWLILLILGLTILSTLSGLPVFYFGIALGFFISYLPALGLAFAINLLAIMLTFAMVRGVFSGFFKEKYGKKKTIKKINKQIEKYGMWTIAFSRSIYVLPTNIINFSFPLSKIKVKDYVIGTSIGLFVECMINVTTGYLLKNQVLLLDSPEQNLLQILIISVGLVLIVGVILFLNIRRKRKDARINRIVPKI